MTRPNQISAGGGTSNRLHGCATVVTLEAPSVKWMGPCSVIRHGPPQHTIVYIECQAPVVRLWKLSERYRCYQFSDSVRP